MGVGVGACRWCGGVRDMGVGMCVRRVCGCVRDVCMGGKRCWDEGCLSPKDYM